MILKLGMKHQAIKFYKVYVNYDPWMTLTYFTARSTEVALAFDLGKLLKCHLKCKTCSKLANGLNFCDLEKKLTPGVALTLSWGYMYVYYHPSQTFLRPQVSVYRTIGPLVSTCTLRQRNDPEQL